MYFNTAVLRNKKVENEHFQIRLPLLCAAPLPSMVPGPEELYCLGLLESDRNAILTGSCD